MKKTDIKHRRLLRAVWTLLSYASLFLCTCSGGMQTAGGNSSEEGNGRIVGAVYTANGGGAAGATVKAIRFTGNTDSLPDSIPVTLTDQQGTYTFDSLDTGLYSIEARLDTMGAIVEGVALNKYSTPVQAPGAILRGMGYIRGVVHLTGPFDPYMRIDIVIGGWWWIKVRTHPDSVFVLGPVLDGDFTLTSTRIGALYQGFMVPVTVIAGDTTVIDTIRPQPVSVP
jgi:hypothetical protein